MGMGIGRNDNENLGNPMGMEYIHTYIYGIYNTQHGRYEHVARIRGAGCC